METMLVIREPGAGRGFKSYFAKNSRTGLTNYPVIPSSSSRSRVRRACRRRIINVTCLGLVLVIGKSVLARSDDATKIGGRSAKDWVAALRSDDLRARWEAYGALMLFGPVATGAVPALVDALDDPRKEVQIKACEALRDIGPGAGAAAPASSESSESEGQILVLHGRRKRPWSPSVPQHCLL